LSKQQTIQSDKCLRLGSCSAYENDHLDAAVALAESGKIDYLIFDCLSEKTISEANLRKIRGDIGYDVFLEEKLRAVLPGSIRHGVKLIANAGAADVEGAARVTTKVCQELGLSGVKVCYVLGDNVLNLVKNQNPIVRETGEKISTFGDKLISAHVYEGAETIVQSLGRGADIVLTGRAGDSAQFLAAMIHEHGWSFNDQDLIGKGLGIGHLLECAGQATGGYHADPNIKEVPDLEFLGFPIANVYPNGDAIITKLPDTGGIVNTRTVTEQLVYEIDDPANYIHTDGIVDFTTTEITEIGKNQVLVSKTTGHSRPQNLKVVIGVLEGFVGMGRAVYCGSRAYDKARLAGEVVVKRMSTLYGGFPFLTSYVASKAALVGLTKNVANALYRDRIRINAINMGWADTPGETVTQKRFHNADENWLEEAEKNMPFGRLVKPDEIARAIAYLTSEESGLMTGSIIDFDQSVDGTHSQDYSTPKLTDTLIGL